MKHIKIPIPEGYIVKEFNRDTGELVIIPKISGLPEKWEDLGEIEGFDIDGAHKIVPANKETVLFYKREQASAVRALAKLSQLMAAYNGGWEPDWEKDTEKYCIVFVSEKPIKQSYTRARHFLAFKNAELRDKFLKNFKELITKARPLL